MYRPMQLTLSHSYIPPSFGVLYSPRLESLSQQSLKALTKELLKGKQQKQNPKSHYHIAHVGLECHGSSC